MVGNCPGGSYPWAIVLVGSCPSGELSWWRVVLGGVVLVENCPGGELSWWRVVLGGVVLVENCPGEELPWWGIVLVVSCPVGNCPVRYCPDTTVIIRGNFLAAMTQMEQPGQVRPSSTKQGMRYLPKWLRTRYDASLRTSSPTYMNWISAST